MDTLENRGFAGLGQQVPADGEGGYTLVVLGASRGGTSATAGILGQLGVFMGRSGEAPMYEDMFLNRAVKEQQDQEFCDRINEYNHQHSIWGYKGTVLNRNLSHYHYMFRNPRYLVVFRDILAIATRASVSAGHQVAPIMARQLNEYGRICEFLRKVDPSALLLSYEKLCQHPAPIVDAIAQFSGIQADGASLQRAQQFVSGTNGGHLNYINTSRSYTSSRDGDKG
jgi:hypothetical protein